MVISHMHACCYILQILLTVIDMKSIFFILSEQNWDVRRYLACTLYEENNSHMEIEI